MRDEHNIGATARAYQFVSMIVGLERLSPIKFSEIRHGASSFKARNFSSSAEISSMISKGNRDGIIFLF